MLCTSDPSQPPLTSAVNTKPRLRLTPQQFVAEFFIQFLLPTLANMDVHEYNANTLQLVLTVPAYFKHVSWESSSHILGEDCVSLP